jgi:hypothetical protein
MAGIPSSSGYNDINRLLRNHSRNQNFNFFSGGETHSKLREGFSLAKVSYLRNSDNGLTYGSMKIGGENRTFKFDKSKGSLSIYSSETDGDGNFKYSRFDFNREQLGNLAGDLSNFSSMNPNEAFNYSKTNARNQLIPDYNIATGNTMQNVLYIDSRGESGGSYTKYSVVFSGRCDD